MHANSSKRLARQLQSTSALSAAMGAFLLMSAPTAQAQSVGCNVIGGACVYSTTGTPTWDGHSAGNPGTPGGTAADYDLDVEGSPHLVDYPTLIASPINATSTGGDGEQGDNNTGGAAGGPGGGGGNITVTVGTNVSGESTDDTIGISAITISSAGGTGGYTGKGNLDNGNADPDGVGGNGGTVNATLDGNFLSDNYRSVYINSNGGTGGRGRYWGAGLSGQGADGAAGGNGGDVTASFQNASGNSQNGWTGQGGGVVQSVGGTGGGGGTAESIDGAQGGDGGAGGNGQSVTVNLGANTNMSQENDNDAALTALSKGGTGGVGGSGGGSGGSAGGGGNAGNVTVNVTGGSLTANGSLSPGLLAQSLGGVGGDGGGASSWVVGPNGGSGAKGGTAGNVSVTGSGLTVVTGDFVDTQDPDNFQGSPGVLAQSVGGGGGSGSDAKGWFAVGGDAGDAAIHGGTANVSLQSNIHTYGMISDGLVAQSIGGGGGKGGDASGTGVGLNLVIGGTGGKGGAGNTASVTSAAGSRILTENAHASGIVAQSVGGGGGSGGSAYSKTESAGFGSSMSLGGTGGGGGDACFAGDSITPACTGTTAINNGRITTLGSDSYGILGQSIGGGGGNGGASTAKAHVVAAEDVAISLAAAIGGNGGTGGSGGLLTATNNGLINTSGSGAVGILAQSVGGGGGAGGDSSSTATASEGAYDISATLSMGGNGGTAGQGGNATGTNSGLILTTGESADGMLIQSVGGGGGSGGGGDGKATSSDGKKISTSLTMGGKGKSGGDGYAVTANNIGGSIITLGDGALGIGAQSVGGGGGRGGGAAGSASGDYSASVTLGANGGNGGSTYHTDGNGDQTSPVTVLNDAKSTIVTFGADATGILAQSIGGGGGAGGKAGSNISTKKSDNDGGNGGATSGSATSQLTAAYDQNGSAALNDYLGLGNAVSFTQSLLGVSDPTSQRALADDDDGVDQELENTAQSKGETDDDNESSSIQLSVALGAAGGSGGSAGAVNVTNQGEIATMGNHADGIVAQAIGGGGGKGGAASTATSNDYSGNLSVGGSGGGGGYGGQPTVINSGKIITKGALSAGIIAQSVAGGGGIGGVSASSVSTASKNSGDDDANDGAFRSLSLSVGGNGGTSYDSGQVRVTSSGAISTAAHDSIGIIAQSITGGGGIVKSLATDLEGAGGSASAKGTDYDIKFKFGGSNGSASGGSGLVNVTTQKGGAITTKGDDSYGILAQSIAGGGGVELGGKPTGSTAADFFASGKTTGSVNDDGVNDPTKNNSGLFVTVGDDVTTSGKGAMGVVAQSIGGGGGLAGDTGWTAQYLGMSGATHMNGSGGYVSVDVGAGATISTAGDNTPAIWAQSIGGGGGRITNKNGAFIGTAGGTGKGGAIDIQVDGAVLATGNYSAGVFAQSNGDKTSNAPISVTIGSAGSVKVGTPTNPTDNSAGQAAGAVIYIDHGGTGANDANGNPVTNTVTNNGTVYGYAGPSNAIAIYSNAGYTRVFNNGTMGGDILLQNGGGQGCFTNAANATFNAGDKVQVGTCGVSNAGTINIAEPGKFGTTAIIGNYTQSPTGTLNIDADLKGNTADKLEITGKAAIAGTVKVNATSVSNKAVTVLSATDGVSLDSQLKQTDYSALFDFPVAVAGNELRIQPTARFADAAAKLGKSKQAVAGNLQHLFDSGASMDAGFTALSNVKTEDVPKAFRTLAGQTLGAVGAFRYNSSRAFVGNLYAGCDPTRETTQSNCAWARAYGNWTQQDETANSLGYHADAKAFQMGAQHELSPNWSISGAVAYESTKFRDDDHTAQVNGDGLLAGASVQYTNGGLEVSGAIDAGYGWYNSKRTVTVGSVNDVAQASPKEWAMGLHSQASYTFDLGTVYIKPSADLHAIRVHAVSYTETGSSPFNLAVQSQNDTWLSGGVGIELGTKIAVGGGAYLKPHVGGAIELSNNNDWQTTARFANQPGSDPFTSFTAVPGTLKRINVGLDLLGSKNVDFSVQYSPEFGDHYTSQTAVANLTYRF